MTPTLDLAPDSAGQAHRRRRPLRAAARSAGALAALVFLVAGAALTLRHHDPVVPIARGAATRAVLRDAPSRAALEHSGWTRTEVTSVDGKLERVSFFAGPHIVFDAALGRDGRVTHGNDFHKLDVAYGAPLLHRLPFLFVSCLLFALMTAVVPLRRLRNLDVFALAGFVVPVVLLDQRLLSASTVLAYVPLLYLAGRCAWLGLGPKRVPEPSTPLFSWVARRWTAEQRHRVLRNGTAAAGLVLTMVTVSASGAIDVGYAAQAGATLLMKGVLPYGHMPPDVVHGDTYPIFTYLFYLPGAALSPVHDLWDDTTMALVVAAGAAILTALGLASGIRRSHRGAPDDERDAAEGADSEAGLRSALAFLVFPPLLIAASTGTTDIVLGALLVGALLTVRRPGRSTGLVAVAAWFKLAPVVLLPLWLAPLRGRALLRAVAAVAAVSATAVAVVVAVGGPGGLRAMASAIGFQFGRESLHSAWTVLGLGAVQPLAQALLLAFVAAAVVRLRRDDGLASDPARYAALAGAVLLGMQIAANYWAYLYLAWAYPCVAFALLGARSERATAVARVSVPRPRAVAAEPAPIGP